MSKHGVPGDNDGVIFAFLIGLVDEAEGLYSKF